MDLCDRAGMVEESERAAAVAAVVRDRPQWRSHCADCEEPLLGHRRPFGRCLPCQVAHERRTGGGR